MKTKTMQFTIGGWSVNVRFADRPRWKNIKKAKKLTKWEATHG